MRPPLHNALSLTKGAGPLAFSTLSRPSCLRTGAMASTTMTSTQQSSKVEGRRSVSAYGYTQAKALVYPSHGEPIDVLRLHGHSISPTHSNQITIRFLASPINPADINQIQGVYPTKPTFTSTLGTPTPSAVGGNEGVAVVTSVGSGVTHLTPGDWVVMARTGFGTWRTHAQTDASNVLKIDDKSGLTPTQVGTVSVNPCTAYRMLRDFASLDPEKGDWFIQNGANSGVGRAAIQLGKRWGLKSINVVRDRADKTAQAALRSELEALGADVVISDAELQDRSSIKDRMKEWTNGGREHIRLGLNCVGGKPGIEMSKYLSSPPGSGLASHCVTYGAMSKQPMMVPASMLIFKNVVFSGFWISEWSDRHPAEKKAMVEEILDMTRKGEFKDVPVREVEWPDNVIGEDVKKLEDKLKTEIQGALEGYRDGKGVFIFKD